MNPMKVPSAVEMYVLQKNAGETIRKQTIEGYGRLAEAHGYILEAASVPLFRIHGKERDLVKGAAHKSMLFASLFIGMSLVEDAIAEGRYLQAHALLRQEMETVARLVEVRKEIPKLESETPRVSHLEASLRRLYGELTGSAHVSSTPSLRSATLVEDHPDHPEMEVARFYPELDLPMARRTFGLHLTLWLYVVEELSHFHAEDGVFGDRESKFLNAAIAIMREENVLENE